MDGEQKSEAANAPNDCFVPNISAQQVIESGADHVTPNSHPSKEKRAVINYGICQHIGTMPRQTAECSFSDLHMRRLRTRQLPMRSKCLGPGAVERVTLEWTTGPLPLHLLMHTVAMTIVMADEKLGPPFYGARLTEIVRYQEEDKVRMAHLEMVVGDFDEFACSPLSESGEHMDGVLDLIHRAARLGFMCLSTDSITCTNGQYRFQDTFACGHQIMRIRLKRDVELNEQLLSLRAASRLFIQLGTDADRNMKEGVMLLLLFHLCRREQTLRSQVRSHLTRTLYFDVPFSQYNIWLEHDVYFVRSALRRAAGVDTTSILDYFESV